MYLKTDQGPDFLRTKFTYTHFSPDARAPRSYHRGGRGQMGGGARFGGVGARARAGLTTTREWVARAVWGDRLVAPGSRRAHLLRLTDRATSPSPPACPEFADSSGISAAESRRPR